MAHRHVQVADSGHFYWWRLILLISAAYQVGIYAYTLTYLTIEPPVERVREALALF